MTPAEIAARLQQIEDCVTNLKLRLSEPGRGFPGFLVGRLVEIRGYTNELIRELTHGGTGL